MTDTERALREQISMLCASLFMRGEQGEMYLPRSRMVF